MKSSSNNHPDLTAYALEELNNVESARVRQILAQSPEARAEYERVLQTINALREQTPPIPRRTLNPRQRETILAMGQFHHKARPARDQARRIVWGMAKLAAAAAVAAGAFGLGMKYAGRMEVVAQSGASTTPAPVTKETASSEASGSTPLVVTDKNEDFKADSAVVEAAPPMKSGAEAVPEQGGSAAVPVATAPVAPAPEVAVAALTPSEPKPEPVPVVTQSSPVAPKAMAAPSFKTFALAKTQPEAALILQPKLLRPKIQSAEFAGLTVAAPLPDRVKNAPAPKSPTPRKPEPQPALVIHNWKADVASCPWDSSRRLVRLFAQIPVEQAALESNDQDYRLVVKFDPAQVQGYRLIMEKSEAPTNAGKMATRFAWYEIIPTKNFSVSRDKPAALGLMEVAQPRGTPSGVSLAPVKFLDNGADWSEKNEAFIFETAMVGFNLLLRGADNVGSLNHRLVLDLAQQSKGDDPQRAKFIQAIQQAQKAAGL